MDEYFLETATVIEVRFGEINMRRDFEDRLVAFVGALISFGLAFIAIFAVGSLNNLMSGMLSDDSFTQLVDKFGIVLFFWAIFALLVSALWTATENLLDSSFQSRLRCLTYHLFMPTTTAGLTIYFQLFAYIQT